MSVLGRIIAILQQPVLTWMEATNVTVEKAMLVTDSTVEVRKSRSQRAVTSSPRLVV